MKTKAKKALKIIFVIGIILAYFLSGYWNKKSISYSQIKTEIVNKNVEKAKLTQDRISVKLKNNTKIEWISNFPEGDESLIQFLDENGVVYEYEKERDWLTIVSIVLLVLIFTGGFSFKLKDGKFGLTFGQEESETQSCFGNEGGLDFNSVVRVGGTLSELQEIVSFLKQPDRYNSRGAKLPKGILLVGPPGTGKTLLARAVAGEAGVPFALFSGSQFVEVFVGQGAARVRNLFDEARKKAPCIIFIDEIDAIGTRRTHASQVGYGSREHDQTLNELLSAMDGSRSVPGVIIIAATNRLEVLDEALLRPGRFDRIINVQLPNLSERLNILQLHSRSAQLADDVSLEKIARITAGLSGADLANIINEAIILSIRNKNEKVSSKELEEAISRRKVGLRTGRQLSEKELYIAAIHETGHAIVAQSLGFCGVHEVSIIPRGQSLGVTMFVPPEEEESYLRSKQELLNEIAILLAGRAAEEIQLKSSSTGASDDIARATEIAKNMVCTLGMSGLGLFDYSGQSKNGNSIFGEETIEKIGLEIKQIMNQGFETANKILQLNIVLLVEMARILKEKEVLEGSELQKILTEVKAL